MFIPFWDWGLVNWGLGILSWLLSKSKMYSPAEQRNTPLIAGNVKGKIVFYSKLIVDVKIFEIVILLY